MGRKQREITQEQYEKIGYLARRLVSKKLIAAKIGYTERGFHKRIKKDPTLRDALEKNYNEGKIGLYVASYFAAIDHRLTHCKTCGRSSDSIEFFWPSCPRCDQEDPEMAGQHTNVTHEYIPANIQMLLHLSKVHLGQSDRALEAKTNHHSDYHPYKDRSEAEIDKELEALAVILNKEYGPKKELGHDELLVDVKKCV
jgi:hypothetical protein